MKAELMFTEVIIRHNLPLSMSDTASKCFKQMFPDSSIAQKYSCSRTKSRVMVEELARDTQRDVSGKMKAWPFSVATDGSNEGDDKFFPINVNVLSIDGLSVEKHLLSFPSLKEDATGKNIFNLLDKELQHFDIGWEKCMAVGSDNAAVMTGKHKGVIAYCREKNENVFMAGCPCHLLHLAAEKAAKELEVSIEDTLVDVYYYLEKSTKRKQSLHSFQDLCGEEQRKILKHGTTRWLSMGKCLGRLLEQWEPLTKFFHSEVEPKKSKQAKVPSTAKGGTSSRSTAKQATVVVPSTAKGGTSSRSTAKQATVVPSTAKGGTSSRSTAKQATVVPSSSTAKGGTSSTKTRPQRVLDTLQSRTKKLYFLFLNNVIPDFDSANVTLQREDPIIHQVRPVVLKLLRNLLIRFVKPSAMVLKSVLSVDYKTPTALKSDADLIIGSSARTFIQNHTISPGTLRCFHKDVRKFLVKASDYIKQSVPLDDPVILNAEVVNPAHLLSPQTQFSAVRYFLKRYPQILDCVGCTVDIVEQEFCSLQVEQVPDNILVIERADDQWREIAALKDGDGNACYIHIAQVMCCILLIPHSNADCERVFSSLRKNKTDFRGSMSSKTVEALLIAKQRHGNLWDRNYSESFLRRAKSATSRALRSQTD
jgi:hypothetical protein